MGTYYYLIAGLPDLSLEDVRLKFMVSSFKTDIYPELSSKDKKLVDLFYLKYDNENLLKLLKDKDALTDQKGKFSAEELISLISAVKEEDEEIEKRFPTYFSLFLSEYFSQENDASYKMGDSLSAFYYDYGMGCPNAFMAAWFEFNQNVNNILTAFSLRKYKQQVAPFIIGKTDVSQAVRKSSARDFGLGGELEYFEKLVRINETDDLVEREKKIDLLKWEWMDNASFFDYFTVERLFVFLLRLEMIERWTSLDKERGAEMFRRIIRSLKDEVPIPREFSASQMKDNV